MALISRRRSATNDENVAENQPELDLREPGSVRPGDDGAESPAAEERAAKIVRRRRIAVRGEGAAEVSENIDREPESSESYEPAGEVSESSSFVGETSDSKAGYDGSSSENGEERAYGDSSQSPDSVSGEAQSGEQSSPSQRGYRSHRGHGNARESGYGAGRERFGRRQSYRDRIAARNAARDEATAQAQIIENPEEFEAKPKLLINDLTKMTMKVLRELAIDYGYPEEDLPAMKKQDLIFVILKSHTERGGLIFASGSLEILPDGYGFLRSPQNSYLPGPDDIYISPSQIRLFNLKTGDTIYGQTRSPKEGERFFALLRIMTVNFDEPRVAQTRVPFENLTPLYPKEKLTLETISTEYSTRIIDLFSPIGKGQRLLIVAPPKAGKTTILQKVANAITANNPEVYLIVLLIDERPEEVTDMERAIKGEVISSTFDEQATRHVQVAEMVLEKAKRLVEHGRDVVILLDSITRLARAYNVTVPTSGKVLSGGVDSNALHKPKRFFGAARNIEEGGSLTIISTALIDTGSRMDEVIFEEFKGTGNSEIDLDRRLAERRLFPAINIKKSGTRKEELLLDEATLQKLWVLRKVINPMEDAEITELIIEQMKKSRNNEAFLTNMNTGSAGL